MTRLISKTIPSVCNHCHRNSTVMSPLLTCVGFLSRRIQGHGPHAYWPPLPCAWAHHMGTVSTAFGSWAHYCACPQQISPAQTKEKRWEKRFCDSLSFVGNYLPLSDLGGRGQAVPMCYSAHAQWVQCAEESSWAGKNMAENSWPLPTIASIFCSLAAFLGTAKRKKGIKSQGNPCCLQPWDLDWASSGWQDSCCGQTFKYNSTALIFLSIFVDHREN